MGGTSRCGLEVALDADLEVDAVFAFAGELHVARAADRVGVVLIAVVEDIAGGEVEAVAGVEAVVAGEVEAEALGLVVPTGGTEVGGGDGADAFFSDEGPLGHEGEAAAVVVEAPVDDLGGEAAEVRLGGTAVGDEGGVGEEADGAGEVE